MESTVHRARRIGRVLWRHVLIVGVAIAAVLPGSVPAHAQPDSPQSWACGGVEFSTVISGDTSRNGNPVEMSPDGRGRWVPVLFVHGWVGKANHTPDRTGAFSQRIDKTASRVGEVDVTRSLVGQLQSVPGVAPFTFDYYEYSGRWVSDPRIGPALGTAIDCLFERSGGEKVIVVAHSMGGLATRHALSLDENRERKVSSVVTFGTPNTGSVLAQLLADALTVPTDLAAVIRSILAECGRQTTTSMSTDTCSSLDDVIRAFDGEAGRALRTKSEELRKLRPYPTSVAVHTLYGDARVRATFGWFGLPQRTVETRPGDLIVTPESALAGSASNASSESIRCDYELMPAQNVIDQGLATLHLKPLSDTPEPFTDPLGGACFHGNLMRSVELSNAATIAVESDIVSRLQNLAPTRVTSLAAVSAAGSPAEGFTVTGDAGIVDCATNASPTSITDDVYTCAPTAANADVCWPEAGNRTLLCADDPWNRSLRRAHPHESLLSARASNDPEPWALELTNGAQCRIRNGGSWGGRTDGLDGAYACDDESFVLAGSLEPVIDSNLPVWTVRVGPLGDSDAEFPVPTVAGIRQAWFSASASEQPPAPGSP